MYPKLTCTIPQLTVHPGSTVTLFMDDGSGRPSTVELRVRQDGTKEMFMSPNEVHTNSFDDWEALWLQNTNL